MRFDVWKEIQANPNIAPVGLIQDPDAVCGATRDFTSTSQTIFDTALVPFFFFLGVFPLTSCSTELLFVVQQRSETVNRI